MYFRQSNQSFYGTPAPHQDCIVQAEIMALTALKKWCFQNDANFLSIYINVDEAVLLERLEARNDPNEEPQVRLLEDRYHQEFAHWSDVVYEYTGKTIPEGIDDLFQVIIERFPHLAN